MATAPPRIPWPPITAVLKEELDEAGIFQTDIVTAPKADADFSNFKPDFSKYQVIVLNYDAQDWPESLKTPFEAFVKNGGGLVTVHAAETAFPNWKEFNEMIGASGFRGRTDKDGPPVVHEGWQARLRERARTGRRARQPRTLPGHGAGSEPSNHQRSAENLDASGR